MIAALLVWVVAGCALDAVGPERASEIVVFGHLYVGETISEENAILVTRLQPLGSAYQRDEAAVIDAVVTLRRDGGNPADTLFLGEPGYYANPSVVIEPRTTYRLRVETPRGEVITSSTTTPHELSVLRGPVEHPRAIRHGALRDSFPIDIDCPSGDQIILLDVFCLEDWADARYVRPVGRDRPADYEEFGGDHGAPRHLHAYFRFRSLRRVEAGRRIDWYGSLMAFYGRQTVQVLAIDSNTYRSLVRERPVEESGVRGGLGVFGSACRVVFDLEVVP